MPPPPPDEKDQKRLPTFVIAGAAKAGTTSLYHYLGQHPGVFMSPVKEPNFFCFSGREMHFEGPGADWLMRTSVTDLTAYQGLFAPAHAEHALGEASPLYLYYPQAPERMRRHAPGLKIILVLRDPVERAYAHYWHMVKYGLEPGRTFEEALAAEAGRVASNWMPGFFYTRLGFYHAQVKRFFDTLGWEQTSIHLYEDLGANAAGVLRALFRFLDVDSTFTPSVSLRHNASGLPKSRLLHRLMTGESPIRQALRTALPLPVKRHLYVRLWSANMRKPAMQPETRARLRALYRDDILRLQDLIQRDLGAWLHA